MANKDPESNGTETGASHGGQDSIEEADNEPEPIEDRSTTETSSERNDAETQDKTHSEERSAPSRPKPRRSRGKTLSKRTQIVAVTGVIVAFIGVGATITGILVTHKDAPPRTATEREIRDYAANEWGDVEPTGQGPWTMIVVAGSDVPDPSGLQVHSSPFNDSYQIGTAADREYVWARCRIDSGFNPRPSIPQFGSIWFGINWPTNSPTQAVRNSSISDQHVGYVWSGAVAPQGQNENLPQC